MGKGHLAPSIPPLFVFIVQWQDIDWKMACLMEGADIAIFPSRLERMSPRDHGTVCQATMQPSASVVRDPSQMQKDLITTGGWLHRKA